MSEHGPNQYPGHQPPYAPQPGYPPPPPDGAHNKKRRWPLIVGGILLAMLLFIGGCSLLLYRFTRGPIDAANEFLADVSAQQFSAASEHMDPSCFAADQTSSEALRSFFGDTVNAYDLTNVSNENNLTGTASGTITRTGFGQQSIAFQMTRSADEWLVCGFSVD